MNYVRLSRAQPPEPHSQALANKLASEATSDWGQDNMFGTTVYFIYPHRRYKNDLSISFHVLAIHPYMLEPHRWKVSTSCAFPSFFVVLAS